MDKILDERSQESSPQSESRLEILDAAKGLAACIIVAHHLCEYSPSSDVADRFAPSLMYCIYNYGLFAVYLFLVFGGFAIAWSTSDRPVSWDIATRTFVSRYIRLVVPYLVMLMLLLSCYYYGFGSSISPPIIDSFSWLQFAAHLFFLQDILGYGNLSAGIWYLCIDIQFVALFLLVQLASNSIRKHFFPKLPAAMIMTICFFPLGMMSIWLWSKDQSNDTLVIYFLGTMVLGALVAWEWKKQIPTWVLLLYLAAMAASLADDLRPRILIGMGSAILIWLTLRFGRTFHVPPTLVWLGKISYSLFLIHYLVNCLVLHGLHAWIDNSPLRAFASMIVATFASVLAAAALYRWVEAPSHRWVKSIEKKARCEAEDAGGQLAYATASSG
jgi:peptidoglycan/LPS O-acetylase OafA/YrhL